MHQLRVRIPAGDRQIAHRQRVHLERRQRLLFGYIHLVICGGVQDHGRIAAGDGPLDGVFDGMGIGDIDGGTVEAGDFVAARGKFRFQLRAELAPAAKQRDAFHLSPASP